MSPPQRYTRRVALRDSDKIDVIGLSKVDGTCVLTIVDTEDWTQIGDHLLLLQEKLNTYFAFIESGELATSYPKAANHPVRIDVLFMFPHPSEAEKFLETAAQLTKETGVGLTWGPLPAKVEDV
jgi:hypothetical protein